MRWGIVGASTIAREFMIPAIRATGGEVVSLLSNDAARGELYARGHQIAQSFTDLTAFIESGVDAIYIGSTNEQHKAPTLAAAARGIHVLCDKPLAMSLSDVRDMIAACERGGVVLATNHHLRNAATHVAIKQLLTERRIGTVTAARVFHAVRLPAHLQTWRLNNPRAGAGVILDITCHDVDILRFHLGCNPIAVCAMAQNSGMAVEGVEDGVMATWEFARNIVAQTHEAFTATDARTGIEFIGTEGSIIGEDNMAQRPTGSVTLRRNGKSESIDTPPNNLYELAISRFVGTTRGGNVPSATGIDGYWSLAGALACAQSARTGRTTPVESY
jgi:1,5-anhydro-D-fructose reductase (1,5-anhydro-D-mannitol-forming)